MFAIEDLERELWRLDQRPAEARSDRSVPAVPNAQATVA